ncbi:Retrovirus-related Pol polyprotein from transposon TNT 1-94 [Linum grandiflorum]
MVRMDDSNGVMIKLTSSNYAIWKPRMEDILFCKDLYEPIESGSEKPEDKTEKEWEVLHRKAVAIIRQWIDQSIFHHVAKDTRADELWQKLESMYERQSAQNKASLIRRVVNLKYKDGHSVTEHLSDFQGLVNQLTTMKLALDDEVQALLLLSSLPDSWETLVVSLSNSAPNGKLTMDIVKDSMLNEEARRKELGTSSDSHALVADKSENRGRGKNRNSNFKNFRNRSNSRGKYRGRSKSVSRPKGEITCYHCNQPGHIRRECRILKREQARERGGENRDKDDTIAAATDGEVVIVCDAGFVNLACQESTWVIDSGASFYVTSRVDFFSSYTNGDYGCVRMGNDGASKIVGMGDIHLETNTGCKLVLKEVRHVPDMRLNLISTGKLDDDGYTSYFGEGKWKLSRGSLVVAKGKKESTLYMTSAKHSKGGINVVEKDSSIELWHKRLGHLSEKGLQILSKKQLLPGAKDKTLGGASYYVTFIDDHSRKVWTYALKTKDQVLDVFKQFHVEVERETGLKLKCVRADNGGEYRGPFENYCRFHGIKLQKSVPKTPQHNGVAERMNRTICERIKCMLSHAKLPKSFWGEAMRTAVDLINLSPSVPLEGDVPQRVWSGKDVSYEHLRVFGCKAYVHVPRDERAKLDDKAKPCIFMGYGREEFGYRLWDPIARKIIRSRDVIFLEAETSEDVEGGGNNKNSAAGPVNLEPISPPQTHGNDEEVVLDEPQGALDQEVQEDEHLEQEEQPQPQLRRSTREHKASTRYSPNEYVMLSDGGEPECYQEAMSHEDKGEWNKAMQEEMKSLHDNHTYDLVKLPKGKRSLKNKWVYKLKTEETSSKPRYKARLVVKGFSQKKGVDFEEIFSPVVKMSSIRVVLGLAANLDLEVEQLDVKTAFLHGDLEEEIYMDQPEGFEVKGKENLVCRLRKSLYGLKQAPRQWYKKFDSFMVNHGYARTTSDHCVFVKYFAENDFIILLLYVDDMLVVGRNVGEIARLKEELSKSFAMKDLGPAKQILGMKISRDRRNGKIWLSQEKYIERVLERFKMSKAKTVSTPLAGHFNLSSKHCPTSEEDKEEMKNVPYASAVGSLMYAMVCTRPDIAHAVGVVSRFLSNPGKEHWAAVKWILRYLRGTSRVCLCFGNGKAMLEGYTDANMAGDVDSRKSTSGYMMTFAGAAVSWQSRLQKCVALSTTEAEYIAVTEACKEVLWLKKFLQELGIKQERSKHIDVRYHWIRDALEEKLLELDKVHTDDNGSDMMTKSLPSEKLVFCRKEAGLMLPTI